MNQNQTPVSIFCPRNLVWSLEKLVFRKETFERSARLLLALAAGENENFGNSASGIFKQLFQLYLSGTEADPTARLLVLDEGLKSTDEGTRRICVDALGHMLDTSHFSRGGGAEQIGSADALEDWQPKTYGEIHEFYRAGMMRLLSIVESDAPLASLAKGYLADHIRGLLNALPAAEIKATIDTVTNCNGFWPEALMSISDWLYFDREKDTPVDVSTEIRQMYDALLPSDPVDLADLYTRGWPSDLHDPDALYDSNPSAKHDYEYASRQAAVIALEVAKDATLVQRSLERLACSDNHGVHPFAKELMKQVDDPYALFDKAIEVAERSENQPSRGFFGGLIAGADERDREVAKALVQSALKSPKLKGEAITLIGSGHLQEDDIQLVIALLKGGDIEPWQCQNLGVMQLDGPLLLPLLEELECHGSDGLWTILDIVGMYLHGGVHTATKELATLIKRVLISPELMNAARGHMDGYHMEKMVERLVKLGAVNKTYATKLAKQVMRICRQGTNRHLSELHDPVRKVLNSLMTLHPDAVWNEISKKLTSKSSYDQFCAERLLKARKLDENHLERGIAFHVPTQVYLDWVRKMPKDRAEMAVAWLPVAEKDNTGRFKWHAELEAFVSEFADQPGVMPAVSRRFIPNSYWGGLARYLEPIVPLVESWSTHPNATVRSWVGGQLDWLHKTIVEETKRSEEDAVHLG